MNIDPADMKVDINKLFTNYDVSNEIKSYIYTKIDINNDMLYVYDGNKIVVKYKLERAE